MFTTGIMYFVSTYKTANSHQSAKNVAFDKVRYLSSKDELLVIMRLGLNSLRQRKVICAHRELLVSALHRDKGS